MAQETWPNSPTRLWELRRWRSDLVFLAARSGFACVDRPRAGANDQLCRCRHRACPGLWCRHQEALQGPQSRQQRDPHLSRSEPGESFANLHVDARWRRGVDRAAPCCAGQRFQGMRRARKAVVQGRRRRGAHPPVPDQDRALGRRKMQRRDYQRVMVQLRYSVGIRWQKGSTQC